MKKIYLLLFFAIFLVGTVFAYSITYQKGINNAPDTAVALTVGNTYYGTMQLESHPTVNYVKPVRTGNQVVLWYDTNFTFSQTLGVPTFIDVKTGKQVNKSYQFVYINRTSPYNITSTVTKSVCQSYTSFIDKNGSKGFYCNWKNTTTQQINVIYPNPVRWTPLKTPLAPYGNMSIGIMVNVLPDETIDVIPSIAGNSITKNAIYSSAATVNYFTSGGFNYSAYTYINDGTFNTTNDVNATVLLIGGGGGGGGANQTDYPNGGAGGGAGGLVYLTNFTIPTGNYSFTVGAGGAGGFGTNGTNGGNTTAFGYTAVGGGYGGYGNSTGTLNVQGFTEFNPTNPNTPDTQSQFTGEAIQPLHDMTVINMTVNSSVTATSAYIYADNLPSGGGTLVAYAPLISKVATFHMFPNLTTTKVYYLLVDSNGSAYTDTYNTGATTPQSTSNITWIWGIPQTEANQSNQAYSIESLGFTFNLAATSSPAISDGGNGGHGGGSSGGNQVISQSTQPAYTNTSGALIYVYGNTGGITDGNQAHGQGAGGGALASGGNGSNDLGGTGGAGITLNLNGTAICYDGGGGGSSGANDANFGTATCGGGSSSTHFNGNNGIAGTGGGGGGAGFATTPSLAGGDGGIGTVTILVPLGLIPTINLTALYPPNNTLFTNNFTIPITVDVENMTGVDIVNFTLAFTGTSTFNDTFSPMNKGIFSLPISFPVQNATYFWTANAFGNDSNEYFLSNGTLSFSTLDFLVPPHQVVQFPNFTEGFDKGDFLLNNLSSYWDNMSYPPSVNNYMVFQLTNPDNNQLVNLSTKTPVISPALTHNEGLLTTNFSLYVGGLSTSFYQEPIYIGVSTFESNATVKITPIGCNDEGCTQGNDFYIFISQSNITNPIATQGGSFIADMSNSLAGIFPESTTLTPIQKLGIVFIVILVINIALLAGLAWNVNPDSILLINALATIALFMFFTSIGYIPAGLIYLIVLIIIGYFFLKGRSNK